MDPLSFPLPTFNVDYSATPDYSGYYPNTDYWNWVNYYYQNGFNYNQPTSTGYSFTPTSTMPTPSTSSRSDSAATPVFSMTTMTPPTTTTPHRPKESPKQCSNCFVTETCQWRNVRSENGIECNACFIYQRKYKKTRPVSAMEKYRSKTTHRQNNSD